MMKRYLVSLAAAACVSASLAPLQQAVAQPSALKPMQDAQRKAEQKAREAKKDDEQAQAHDEAQKQQGAKPASSP
jgi:Ni/Co efflux regulator RcnB